MRLLRFKLALLSTSVAASLALLPTGATAHGVRSDPRDALTARWLAADRASCELAARTRDVPMLERCTANLYAAAPRDARTIELQWALALARGQSVEARALVERARAASVPADGVARMEDATDALLPDSPARILARRAFVSLCLGLVGIGAWLALRRSSLLRHASRWWTAT